MQDEFMWMYDEANMISEYKDKQNKMADLKKQWQAISDKFVNHVWIKRYINDKQKEMLDKYYKMLTDEETSYAEYKKGFNFIAKFMGLNPKIIIIENLVFSKDNKDRDQLVCALKYSKGQAKVKIPEGMSLIHVSTVDGIKALNPSFRSKVKGKYMYPSKRVFLTIAKDIKPTKAGLEHTKTYRYRTTQNISEAYIDPTYSSFKDGCVYIETNNPIPVQKYDKFLEKLFNKIKNGWKDTPRDDSQQNHQQESANYMDESVIDTLSGFLSKVNDWKTSNEAHSRKVFKSNSVSDDDFNNLTEALKILKTSEDYNEYKKAFDKICRYCHIVPRGTILCKLNFTKGKDENKNSIYVEYSYNTKKVDIPADLDLYHNSKVEGIKELKPFFRGKPFSRNGKSGQYFYDKPRIYFTVNKNLPKFLSDNKFTDKLHKYVCKSKIKQGYVDPLVWAGVQGALYVETNKPIPVDEVTPGSKLDWLKRNKNENSNDHSTEEKEKLVEFGMTYELYPELIDEEFSMNDQLLFVNGGFLNTICSDINKAKEIALTLDESQRSNWAKIIYAYESNADFAYYIDNNKNKFAVLEATSNEPYYQRLFKAQGKSLALLAEEFMNDSRDINNYINYHTNIQYQLAQEQLMIQEQQSSVINEQIINSVKYPY